jgi:hypothetical protein
MFDLGSLDDFYLDEQHLAREDTALTGSDFYDQLMNTGPSLEDMPDNEDELDAHVEPVEHSTNRARKRRIDDLESTYRVIQDGILLIYNTKLTLIIPIMLIQLMKIYTMTRPELRNIIRILKRSSQLVTWMS